MARPSKQVTRKPALKVVKSVSASEGRAPHRVRFDPHEAVAFGHEILATEARAILRVSELLGDTFHRAIAMLLECEGQIVVTGMGKPGFIAQKLSSVLASTGVRSFFLHPAEAVHGDLGRVSSGDVVIALSNSGATEELVRLLPALRRIGAKIVAITAEKTSPLGRGADVVLEIGRIDEACPMGLVPTASTAALHAVGDALAMTMLKFRQFSSDEYALFHPGGKLGRSVMRVFEVMRAGDANPVAAQTAKLSDVVVVMTNTAGRPGAANIVDARGRLVGVFTDGDLRRLVEQGRTDFTRPAKDVMTRRPRFIGPEELVLTAAAVMRETKVDQLPVVDADGKPVGLLDVQDLLAARLF